jgi:starch synthase (maltosyl-transferring)
VVIDDIRPSTPNRYPAKAVVGEVVRVSADVFKDGHDVLAARVRWRSRSNGANSGNGSGGKWIVAPMHEVVNDRWEAVIEPSTLGPHELVVEAWTDRYATWRHKATTKVGAGQDIEVELEEGARLMDERAAVKGTGREDQERLFAAAAALRDVGRSTPQRLGIALDSSIAELFTGPEVATDLTASPAAPLWVDRERALYGAWYELFPRSYGGFRGTIDRLPAVAEMGFDILYLPPVHPIGRQYRKGKNNTLEATPDDVGSPWAIGGPEGGHTAINPELGDFDDFAALVDATRAHGMEIALDYALQCSADHPWVKEHPEWFHHRPDGSIAYAENPPKKYQDIYPINFWPSRDEDRQALWDACKDILDFWIGKGVHVFRVDNPHTKPMAFWAWLIPAVQADHPDVFFLAEAFTRPKVMAKLAEVGFSQSYTYFTWRTTQHGDEGLRAYMEELAHSSKADYMRPNFWPNTPDILSGPLRDGPLAAFKQRLVLAAGLAPSYGIYSGYELGENEPASTTNEEYRDSEKFEIKKRDWSDPRSLASWIGLVNEIRRRHPALHRLRNVHLHDSSNDQVMVWSKHTEDRSDVVLFVTSLDPFNTQDAVLTLDLGLLGLPWDQTFEAYDELTGQSFTWQGSHPYVRLDPYQAAHILHLRPFA